MKVYNEIRLDNKKQLDDIVIYDIHLERMADRFWWLGIYKGKKRTCFWIKSKSKIFVEVQDNELDTEIVKG